MPDHSLNEGERANRVIAFGEPGSTELAVAGGKGASLGRLVRAGFPVPSGFIITTRAYSLFLQANDLEQTIGKILEGLDYDDLDRLEEKTGKIREAIREGLIPEDLALEILGAYGKLGEEPCVAVRSSGTAEDLEGASFAGQYDTFLDIQGSEALLKAVRGCWASMWTARVTAYRQKKVKWSAYNERAPG